MEYYLFKVKCFQKVKTKRKPKGMEWVPRWGCHLACASEGNTKTVQNYKLESLKNTAITHVVFYPMGHPMGVMTTWSSCSRQEPIMSRKRLSGIQTCMTGIKQNVMICQYVSHDVSQMTFLLTNIILCFEEFD